MASSKARDRQVFGVMKINENQTLQAAQASGPKFSSEASEISITLPFDESQAWQAYQPSEPKFPMRASEISFSLPPRPLSAKPANQ